DVSVASGIGTRPGPALGVVAADLTGDGWPDIFVANDAKPNHLWVNQRNGTFTEEAVSRGLAYTAMGQAYAGMGIAVGDADNDGMLDLYVTHLTVETNTLWVQGPRGLFRDRTVEAGLAGTRWRATGFGTVLADFDHDGWADLAVVNGRVSRADRVADGSDRLGFWAPYAERNQLLANAGDGKFTDVSPAGGRRWLRLVNPGDSFLSSGSPLAHFGLGAADRVDHVEVRWPDGSRERFPGGTTDRTVTVRRGTGEAVR